MTRDDKPLLRVRSVVKEYEIFGSGAQSLKNVLFGIGHGSRIRVLDDISFDIHRGEVVGIVGRNGAGKSTLLRVICGIQGFNSGSLEIDGKANAILDLGIGFSTEASGYDNILFGGLCQGMTSREVREMMDWIIDFAELREKINQPLLTYSTGQRMRLAFATAISRPADLLVIDEAMAVGDVMFQEKCFRRLRQLAADGTTVLFVSHSPTHIQQLCTRAILLENGKVHADGDPALVTYAYEHLNAQQQADRQSDRDIIRLTVGDSRDGVRDDRLAAYITDIEVVDTNGRPVADMVGGARYSVRLTVTANVDIPVISPGFRIELPSGFAVCGTSLTNIGQFPSIQSGETQTYLFDFHARLATGEYLLGAGLAIADSPDDARNGGFVVVDTVRKAKILTVRNTNQIYGFADIIDCVRQGHPFQADRGQAVPP